MIEAFMCLSDTWNFAVGLIKCNSKWNPQTSIQVVKSNKQCWCCDKKNTPHLLSVLPVGTEHVQHDVCTHCSPPGCYSTAPLWQPDLGGLGPFPSHFYTLGSSTGDQMRSEGVLGSDGTGTSPELLKEVISRGRSSKICQDIYFFCLKAKLWHLFNSFIYGTFFHQMFNEQLTQEQKI